MRGPLVIRSVRAWQWKTVGACASSARMTQSGTCDSSAGRYPSAINPAVPCQPLRGEVCLTGDGDEGVELRVEALDPSEDRLRHRDGRHLPPGDEGRDLPK